MSLFFNSALIGKRPMDRTRGRRAAPRTLRPSLGLTNRLVATVDAALIIALAVVFQAFGPRAGQWLTPGQALIVGVIGASAVLAALGPSGSYGPERRLRLGCAGFDILIGVTVGAIASRLLVWAFAPKVLHANTWLLMWTMAVVVALFAARLVAVQIDARIGDHAWLRRRIAVVGGSDGGRILGERLANDPQFDLVGRFGEKGDGDLHLLRRAAETEGLDVIVLAAPWSAPERLFALAAELQWISADVVALIDDPDAFKGSRLRTEIGGQPALVLHRHPLKGAEALVKMAQDYAVATVALVLVSPLLAGVALVLAVAGGGPVLFRQKRLGFNGRPFTIYKFRTMRTDPTDDGSRGAVKGDDRCTRIGAFLRKTSLDELPQLFNVLHGDMSIVGPRPHVANMQVGPGAYAEVVRAYAARHQIKPGITGWAQINGMRGGIDSLAKARQGVELDLHYIRNWSLWLDLRIMLATLFRNLAGPSVF